MFNLYATIIEALSSVFARNEHAHASVSDDEPIDIGPVNKIIHAALGALGVKDGDW